MFEPITILVALTAAGLVSALVGSAARWARLDDAWMFSLAVGLGCYIGLAMLGVRPRWPFREDQDRFLGLVLPTILFAEAGFRTLRLPSRRGVVARFVAAAAVAPAILYGSIYVVDLAGPGSAEWPPIERGQILGGLGLAVGSAWSVLVWIQSRTRSAIRVPLALATALAGAGLAVMLSGYASGGMLAFPLAAAILGVCLAMVFRRADGRASSPGVGLVGLSSLLMMGAYFGRLGTAEAVALFLFPLLAGILEIVRVVGGRLLALRIYARKPSE